MNASARVHGIIMREAKKSLSQTALTLENIRRELVQPPASWSTSLQKGHLRVSGRAACWAAREMRGAAVLIRRHFAMQCLCTFVWQHDMMPATEKK